LLGGGRGDAVDAEVGGEREHGVGAGCVGVLRLRDDGVCAYVCEEGRGDGGEERLAGELVVEDGEDGNAVRGGVGERRAGYGE
jgi:hypothetical protein